MTGYKAEMDKLRRKGSALELATDELEKRVKQQEDAYGALLHVEDFCQNVAAGLDALSFEDRQQVVRLLVERITALDGRVRVEAIVPSSDDDVTLRTLRRELV